MYMLFQYEFHICKFFLEKNITHAYNIYPRMPFFTPNKTVYNRQRKYDKFYFFD